jgi:predicted lipoprotein with Yx(FWY)xxD motif
MKHPGIVISSLSIAALAVGGGIVGFTSGGGGSGPQHGVTVKTGTATVASSTETILETAKGMPLYTYQPDSPTQSQVTGKLAALWPPLTATSPTSTVGGGQVTAVKDIHGSQVEFNGHLLYTFVTDRPGQVTGQGVQNFFVATPELMSPPGTPAATTPPSTPPAANSYSYGY